MVVLAVIERARAEVGGRPAKDRAYRASLVSHREGDGWIRMARGLGISPPSQAQRLGLNATEVRFRAMTAW